MVWHSSLKAENILDLERVQKSAIKIILGKNYTNYETSLESLNLVNLEVRRSELCLKFAKKSLKNHKTKHMFVDREKPHKMKLRHEEGIKVDKALTARKQKSPLIFMQKLLNSKL